MPKRRSSTTGVLSCLRRIPWTACQALSHTQSAVRRAIPSANGGPMGREFVGGEREIMANFAMLAHRLKKPDVIVTSTDVATAAVKRATLTIPIVMALSTDPVATGFVASLTRPGGSIT